MESIRQHERSMTAARKQWYHQAGETLSQTAKLCGVYSITNTQNGKKYVGSSVHVFSRWHGHLTRLRAGKHPNKHLQAAWNKYGENSFTFAVVAEVPEADLLKSEAVVMTAFGTCSSDIGYNLMVPDTDRKIRMSEESRARISAAQRGRRASPATRAKMSASQKLRRHTPETIERMRAAAKLRVITPETRALMYANRRSNRDSVELTRKSSSNHNSARSARGAAKRAAEEVS